MFSHKNVTMLESAIQHKQHQQHLQNFFTLTALLHFSLLSLFPPHSSMTLTCVVLSSCRRRPLVWTKLLRHREDQGKKKRVSSWEALIFYGYHPCMYFDFISMYRHRLIFLPLCAASVHIFLRYLSMPYTNRSLFPMDRCAIHVRKGSSSSSGDDNNKRTTQKIYNVNLQRAIDIFCRLSLGLRLVGAWETLLIVFNSRTCSLLLALPSSLFSLFLIVILMMANLLC